MKYLNCFKSLKIMLVAASLSVSVQAAEEPAPRIVSAGNGITEIIYALGAGDQVVAVDGSSVFPQEVNELPKIGYHKQMSAEGVLALQPTLLIGTEDMGPSSALEQMSDAGIDIKAMPLRNSTDNIKLRVKELGGLLDREKEAETLWQSISDDLAEAEHIAEGKKKPKVVFLLNMGGRTPSVSGNDTSANALIELAGGYNPAADSFNSYKPLSNEAMLVMAPDVILYSDMGNGMEAKELLDMQPILKQTPAGKNGRLVAIDPHILLGGLGPRTGEMAVELAKELFSSKS